MTKASLSAWTALAVLTAAADAAQASGFAIDPDPSSPTLGELVDHERTVAGALRGAVGGRPRPTITRVPYAPREAVTVIVPGRRLR